ncbi:hypothetical protein NUW54_g11153 [Trametes sanguinea]|uniref:Uncharacterized protein n=1 Tax=Trametes sanguinea TaxID=158606 RepID=A0ACC1NKI9_9APHY|nr:hypothetical protein NUW54_g11153 [Trametes sanguinea]
MTAECLPAVEAHKRRRHVRSPNEGCRSRSLKQEGTSTLRGNDEQTVGPERSMRTSHVRVIPGTTYAPSDGEGHPSKEVGSPTLGRVRDEHGAVKVSSGGLRCGTTPRNREAGVNVRSRDGQGLGVPRAAVCAHLRLLGVWRDRPLQDAAKVGVGVMIESSSLTPEEMGMVPPPGVPAVPMPQP